MTVTIVVCCYNRAHMLPQTMASIFAQEYQPAEIVVLDDGSTDNTAELMAGYGDRIRYYHQENQGIAATRNNACRLAQGEYIAFIDDDDLMPPERIRTLLDALQQHPAAVMAVGDVAIIDDRGNLTGHRWLPESADNNQTRLIEDGYAAVLWPKVPAALHTTLFRKADGEKIGWFDTQYRFTSEDKDFLARLGKLGPVVYVPRVVSYYRRGHESLTKNRMRAACGKLLCLENHLATLTPASGPLYQRLQQRILVTLKKIAFHKRKGFPIPADGYSEDYLAKGLSLLGLRKRIDYWWHVSVKLPLRYLFRG